MPLSLSIIIPAYDEARRIGATLQQVFDYLNRQDYDSELIVVDDGSKDDTVRVVGEIFSSTMRGRVESRLVEVRPNRGKGHAVRTGLIEARAPVALFSDADLSTPIIETPKLVEPIRQGHYDVVFGSRALDRSLVGVHQPWLREQSGRFFNLIMRVATGLPYWDTQCGFKAFRLDVCRPLFEGAVIDRFGFDVELLYLAHAAGLRLCEQPVRWDDAEGSKVGFRTGLDGFNELLQVRRNARRGLYDAATACARELAARVEGTRPAPPAESEPKNDYARELTEQSV
jgi:glycosyltransferase involved in cell wall biosynthesis